MHDSEEGAFSKGGNPLVLDYHGHITDPILEEEPEGISPHVRQDQITLAIWEDYQHDFATRDCPLGDSSGNEIFLSNSNDSN